jgi:hypothetical protein
MLTPEDLQQIATTTAAAEQRTGARIEQTASELKNTIEHSQAQTIEAMRDMQTEILKGIEAFARGNFARMHRLETSDADTNTRIAALEERVLMIETRQRPPQ